MRVRTRAAQLTRLQIERLRDLAAATVRLLELRRAADALAHAATRDPLTGLPNRTLFLESLDRAFARMGRSIRLPGSCSWTSTASSGSTTRSATPPGTSCCAGDDRLLGAVRATELVARLGGDEFVVLVEDPVGDEDGLAEVADRVRVALNGPVALPDGRVVQLGASVGMSRGLGPSDSPAALLERADAAMYEEKARRASALPGAGKCPGRTASRARIGTRASIGTSGRPSRW